jgi:hypothetical protein
MSPYNSKKNRLPQSSQSSLRKNIFFSAFFAGYLPPAMGVR